MSVIGDRYAWARIVNLIGSVPHRATATSQHWDDDFVSRLGEIPTWRAPTIHTLHWYAETLVSNYLCVSTRYMPNVLLDCLSFLKLRASVPPRSASHCTYRAFPGATLFDLLASHSITAIRFTDSKNSATDAASR